MKLEYGFVNHVDLGCSDIGLVAHERLVKYHNEGIINLNHKVDRIVYDLDILMDEHYGKDSISWARKALGLVVNNQLRTDSAKYLAKTNELLQGWTR